MTPARRSARASCAALLGGRDLGACFDGLRLFAGGAGWAPNQLEDELREGAWWVLPSVDDDVLTSDPDSLWVRVLRRQRGDVAWFANHPLDPSQN